MKNHTHGFGFGAKHRRRVEQARKKIVWSICALCKIEFRNILVPTARFCTPECRRQSFAQRD